MMTFSKIGNFPVHEITLFVDWMQIYNQDVPIEAYTWYRFLSGMISRINTPNGNSNIMYGQIFIQ